MSAVPVEADQDVTLRRRRSGLAAGYRRPLALIGGAVVLAWILIAVLAPVLAPQGPLSVSPDLLQPPSAQHLFGTDDLGRDVLSRVIYGARVSLPLAVLLVALSMTVGATIGAVAGYFGSWVDTVAMRTVDLVFAFPAIILAMVVAAVLGPNLHNAVLALVVVSWPSYARVVRGLVMSAARAEYVKTSRLLGAPAWKALVRDIRPNVVGPVVVLATLDIGHAVLLLAGLSFLGLGAQLPTAEWGSMIAGSTQHFESWWLGTFPGIAIFSLVLGFNFLGDSLRDVLDRRSLWGSGERL